MHNDFKINKDWIDMKKDLTRKTSLYTTWRSIKFTPKGKKVGWDSSWNTYEKFRDDMIIGWRSGLVIQRKNKRLPFSKENCCWIERCNQKQFNLISIEHNGEIRTVKE
jgi:hypothetical protein